MPACLNLQCQVKKEPHRAAPNRKERQKRKIFIQLSEPFGLWLSLLIEGAPKSKGEASVDEVSLVTLPAGRSGRLWHFSGALPCQSSPYSLFANGPHGHCRRCCP